MMRHNNLLREYFWIICGTASLGLGIVGILLPVLPTTPFVLLAAFCYGRGSRRFYTWLVDRSPFRSYIRNYRAGRKLPMPQRVLTILLLWLSIGSTVAFLTTTPWLRVLLLVVACGVTIHLSGIRVSLPPLRGWLKRAQPAKPVEIAPTRAPGEEG